MKNFITFTFLSIIGLLVTPAQANTAQRCMAKAIYFESRGGSQRDMLAVGHTVMNRVRSNMFPNSVCNVVRQRHQFSANINRGTPIREPESWRKSLEYANKVISGSSSDFTNGATFFHNRSVKPSWSYRFNRVYSNSQHIFYKP